MRTNIGSLILVTVLSGCLEESSTISAPGSAPGSGEIRVSLDVSGDPSTGLADYPVFVDGIARARMRPGDSVAVTVPTGEHTIGLERYSLFADVWWCGYTGPRTYSVMADGLSSPHVRFSLDCPSLEGKGRIALTFYEPSISAKTDLSVSLVRLNGTPHILTFTAQPEVETEISIEPGLYNISAGNSRCTMSYVVQAFDFGHVVAVRNNTTSKHSYSMVCQ